MEPTENSQDSSGSGSMPSGSGNFMLNNKPDEPPTLVTAPPPIVIAPSNVGASLPEPQSRDQDAAQFRLETEQSTQAPATNASYSLGQASVSAAMPGAGAGLPSGKVVTGPEATSGNLGLSPTSNFYAPPPAAPTPEMPRQLFVADSGGVGTGQSLPSRGGKLPKRKLILGGSLAAVVLLGSLGYVFAFYIPNKPANVFQTGLSRSGENLTKLVNKFTEKDKLERLKNSEITATAEAKAADYTFNGTFGVKLAKTKSDGSLDIRLKSGSEAEKALNLKFLTDLPDGKKYPDLYFQVNGLKALGLDAFAPNILAFDGKWIAAESDYLESTLTAQNAPKSRENVTSEDIASLVRTISSTSNEYLLTSDKKKAVLENKAFVGKEKTDGINTYHYVVGINKDHAKDFCKALTDRVISHPTYKKFLDLDDAGVAEQKKDIDKNCNDQVDRGIKDDTTMDLWIDAKYKLIHKLRVYDEKDKQTYTDIGQLYKGGDKINFFIAVHEEENKADFKFTVDVDTKAYTSNGSFTWNQNDGSGMDAKITFEAKPYDGEVTVEKPAGAINVQEVLNALGFGALETSTTPTTSAAPSGSIQAQAKDVERQTDIKAMHAQVEAYYAQNGFYPSLANLNNASWRTANMKGLDSEALRDPDGSSATLAAKATSKQYGYAVSGCAGAGTAQCLAYTLTAVLSNGSTFDKVNLN